MGWVSYFGLEKLFMRSTNPFEKTVTVNNRGTASSSGIRTTDDKDVAVSDYLHVS